MTDTHPHRIFVYGTLKSGHGNFPLLARHESIFDGPAVTVDKFLLNDGFPYVFPLTAFPGRDIEAFMGHIRGETYRVTDEGLAACDSLEGHPTGYTRTPIKITYFVDGPGEQEAEAGIYLMVRRSYASDLQMPDPSGFLEWGRGFRESARNFQRFSGKRYKR